MKVKLDNNDYEIIEDYKNGFIEEEVKKKYTDYFESFDYILGDWSYGKLRLKGFCDKNNKLFNKINDYNNIKNYLEENCAFDCKHFILKKTT